MKNINPKYPKTSREAAAAPAEMPSYSQSPSLHEWRFATLSFRTKFWRMRRGQTGFSWFHHPVWKHGIKRWWRNHLTLNVCTCLCRRLLQPDGDGLSRVKQVVLYVSPGQQMIQEMVQMSAAGLLANGSSRIRATLSRVPTAIRWWWSDPVSPPLEVQEVTERNNNLHF